MINFFKDTYANLSARLSGANNICFATDRQVIILGGKQYGKDQVKVVASASDISSTDAAVGTIFFVTDDQSVRQKTSDGSTIIINPTLTSTSFVGSDDANGVTTFNANATDSYQATAADIVSSILHLEGKVSGAYGAGSNVVVSKAGGIEKTAFTLDTTSGDLALTGTTLSTTLVNAATLKEQIESVNAAQATLLAGSGISVTSANNNGIDWTISAVVSDSVSSSLGFDASGALMDDLKIEKLATATAGYAASYVLKNGKGTQLGTTIDIVKDQFLKNAEYVTGTWDGSTWSSTGTNKYLKLTFEVNTDGDATDSEDQKVIYIDVTELFDTYTGVSGVAVDRATNTISGVVDGSSESFLTVGASGFKVAGVSSAISTAVQGLGSYSAGTDEFITAIGVDATGALTGSAAQAVASGVSFTAIPSSSNNIAVTGTTVQDAFNSIASQVKAGTSSLSAAQVGDSTTYIQYISETDGIISATSAVLDAARVAYNGSNVSAALDSISGVIDGLDLTEVGGGTAPSAGTSNKYSIINTVSQEDGQVAASPIDLTAANVYQPGITAVSTGTSSAVRVGITAGSVQGAIDTMSNTLADYLSFHDASGNVI